MYEIKGLDAFERTLLKTLEVKYPEEVKKKLLELANELKEDVAAKTPLGPGKKAKSKRLRYRWKVGKVRKKGKELFIEVRNTAPHAHLVEDGHRIVTPDGVTIGYVEGKHMLLVSTKQLEKRLTPNLQAWLNKLLGELVL